MEKNNESFQFKKIFLLTLVASLCISALLGIIVFIFGNFGGIESQVLLTALTVCGFSLTGLACAALKEKNTFPTFAAIGMITSVVTFIMYTCLIWEIIDWDLFDDWGIIKILLVLTIASISCAQASLLLFVQSKNVFVNIALSLTIIFISIVGLFTSIIIVGELFDGPNDDILYRILGVLVILDVLGTIVTPILHKVYSQDTLVKSTH